MNVAFVTFGCRLSRAESLDLSARYQSYGHRIIPIPPEGPVPDEMGGPRSVAAADAISPSPEGSVPDEISSGGPRSVAAADAISPSPEGSVPDEISSGGPRSVAAADAMSPSPEGPVPNEMGGPRSVAAADAMSPSHQPTTYAQTPELIIVRGCSVTAKAQRDCEKTIARLRHRFPQAEIKITGCLPNTLPSSALLPPPGPVPATLGTDPATLGTDPTTLGTDPVPMTTSRAYLKVQDGCSCKCAFCIVPTFRGPPRSVPFSDVLKRAQAFLAAGYHEIVVTGCNLALYHSQGKDLPDLLEALARLGTVPTQAGAVPTQAGSVPMPTGTVPARHRIRLGSLEPGVCDDKLIDIFERNENICRFVHLSLQSASDDILMRMGRPYSIATVRHFIEEAFRRLGPRITFGADVIAGFPRETEEDFLATRRFLTNPLIPILNTGTVPISVSEGTVPMDFEGTVPVSASEGTVPVGPTFTHVHAFPYSERPGTPAATFEGAIPVEIRRRRAGILSEEARIRQMAYAEGFIGKTVEVCAETGGDHGMTAEYLSCRLAQPVPRRSLTRVRVTARNGTTLLAIPPAEE